MLWCRGVIPWHYARFLDYTTERMFLQRVGGRYRFIHDLLRDHFAATRTEVNFRHGTSTLNWWKSDQFAESAFWLHA